MSKKAILPVDVTRVSSHQACESCGLRKVKYKAELNLGDQRVKHRLCEHCIEGLRL